MSLHDTGNKARTETGENALAEDDENRRVIVSASDEAIQDYGWPAIWEAAERKYDVGDFTEQEGTRKVSVKTTDCE